MTDLRYPIGELQFTEPVTAEARAARVVAIAAAPARLRAAVDGLDEAQLDTEYRPGGWTVRQVVHHIPDSHLNAYTRLKLALTEEHPTIRPYDEAAWATLPDSAGPIASSLGLLDHLHARWVALLRALPAAAFGRTLYHPESRSVLSIDRLTATYAWHGEHHIAHITSLRTRRGW